jgi:hypothetical protein
MIRLYQDSDYETVKGWWEAWGWTPVAKEALAPLGVIASNGEEDVCCAWLYRTESSLALLEWFISNPKVKKGRKGAMNVVILSLCDIAKKYGFTHIVSFTKDPHFTRLLEKHGFNGRSDYVSNMVRSV